MERGKEEKGSGGKKGGNECEEKGSKERKLSEKLYNGAVNKF